jgi:hypothetical protein
MRVGALYFGRKNGEGNISFEASVDIHMTLYEVMSHKPELNISVNCGRSSAACVPVL